MDACKRGAPAAQLGAPPRLQQVCYFLPPSRKVTRTAAKPNGSAVPVPFNTALALRTTTWLSRPAIVELLIQAINKIVQGRDREASSQEPTAERDIRRRYNLCHILP